MRESKRRKRLTALCAGACLVITFSGCTAATAALGEPEFIELMEPAGVAVTYEPAAYRNLYDAKVYNALICPYAEEYAPDRYMQFGAYGVLPGEAVKKGDALIRTNTENLDKQIKDMEENIAKAEEDFQEYLTETQKALAETLESEKIWGQAVENWAKEKPEEDDPGYEKWLSDNQMYEANYRNALISRQKQEEAIRQRKGLYELDSAHDRLLLKRLREDKNNNLVLSGMSGVVTSLTLLDRYDNMYADVPVAAVADPDRMLVRCDFMSDWTVSKAEEVYAVINGKRYEVEHEPMDTEEYKRLLDENGVVYTTFYLQGDTADVEMGAYAAVVVMNKSKHSVLTVPVDAVTRTTEGSASVYVLQNGEGVSVPVKTGMQDGVYVEIVSGLQEGDLVLTDKAVLKGEKTQKLTKGCISSNFTGMGYLAYPAQEWIRNPVEYGTVYFVESNVNLYQQVKKGDVLAVIRVTPDDVELTRAERSLQRERERLADLQKEDAEQNKKTIEAMRKMISEQEELVAKMKKDFATTEVKAPYDGIITMVPWNLKEGDLLNRDQSLVMLAKQDSNYIVVEDKNGLLAFGNEAAIEYRGQGGSSTEAKGTIVSLNRRCVSTRFYEQELESNVLIKVSPEDIGGMAGSAEGYDGWWNRSRFNISVVTRKMDNVLLVPKKAVTASAGATYVKLVQENGEVLYQSFVAGGANNSYYWVVEGLTEGMELCIE